MCLRLVAGLFVDPAVQIADDALLRAAGAGPQGIVGIFRKHQVVCIEAGPDQLGVSGLRIIEGEMPGRLFDRERLGRGMIGPGLAESRIVGLADA